MPNFLQNLFSFFAGRKRRYYGRKQDSQDLRDHRYVPKAEVLQALPASVDLRPNDPPIFDQGNLGSCTANGWLGLFTFVCMKLFGETFLGSRLMLYYDSRADEGNVGSDSGCEVRTGGKVLNKIGVCSEKEWPYAISKFKQKPPANCYASAKNHLAVEYMRVDQDMPHLKACLAEGFPIVFGFDVYSSFESSVVSRTGIMPMPKKGESIVGGHCVEAVGYVDAAGQAHYFNQSPVKNFFSKLGQKLRAVTGLRVFGVTPPADHVICRNSWGTGWGDAGYFYMPYAFISSSKYAADFWTIRVVTNNKAA